MRIHKLVLGTALIACVLLISFSVNAGGAVQSNPVALLQYIADNMISQLKANKASLKTKPQIVYSLANRYVVPYADIAEMSRRVIPPRVWASATSAERAQFQSKFTRLLVRTYASALTEFQDQSVKFYPVRGNTAGMSTVVVNSVIESPTRQSIQMTYRLLRKGSAWRLYDMSVEGVSLIESFRSQFADILAQGNMEQLLNQLGRHNAGNR
ncbi:MAG: hypothetical protein A3E85_00320 [Gammaproteobacteria bacterium RIFCSPHIGHO2_12_FULL_45_12]|nr:MAG: hypothetical protein A3E85_00320 [Gammaproteobacteria bacterium RIFCSPHIGHO2_12_FULL_45_12]